MNPHVTEEDLMEDDFAWPQSSHSVKRSSPRSTSSSPRKRIKTGGITDIEESSVDIYGDLSMDSIHFDTSRATDNKSTAQSNSEVNIDKDLDLYTDVLISDLSEKAKLQQRIKELEKSNSMLLSQNEALQKLKEQLSKNISCLFMTARKELRQKDQEISTLRNTVEAKSQSTSNASRQIVQSEFHLKENTRDNRRERDASRRHFSRSSEQSDSNRSYSSKRMMKDSSQSSRSSVNASHDNQSRDIIRSPNERNMSNRCVSPFSDRLYNRDKVERFRSDGKDSSKYSSRYLNKGKEERGNKNYNCSQNSASDKEEFNGKRKKYSLSDDQRSISDKEDRLRNKGKYSKREDRSSYRSKEGNLNNNGKDHSRSKDKHLNVDKEDRFVSQRKEELANDRRGKKMDKDGEAEKLHDDEQQIFDNIDLRTKLLLKRNSVGGNHLGSDKKVKPSKSTVRCRSKDRQDDRGDQQEEKGEKPISSSGEASVNDNFVRRNDSSLKDIGKGIEELKANERGSKSHKKMVLDKNKEHSKNNNVQKTEEVEESEDDELSVGEEVDQQRISEVYGLSDTDDNEHIFEDASTEQQGDFHKEIDTNKVIEKNFSDKDHESESSKMNKLDQKRSGDKKIRSTLSQLSNLENEGKNDASKSKKIEESTALKETTINIAVDKTSKPFKSDSPCLENGQQIEEEGESPLTDMSEERKLAKSSSIHDDDNRTSSNPDHGLSSSLVSIESSPFLEQRLDLTEHSSKPLSSILTPVEEHTSEAKTHRRDQRQCSHSDKLSKKVKNVDVTKNSTPLESLSTFVIDATLPTQNITKPEGQRTQMSSEFHLKEIIVEERAQKVVDLEVIKHGSSDNILDVSTNSEHVLVISENVSFHENKSPVISDSFETNMSKVDLKASDCFVSYKDIGDNLTHKTLNQTDPDFISPTPRNLALPSVTLSSQDMSSMASCSSLPFTHSTDDTNFSNLQKEKNQGQPLSPSNHTWPFKITDSLHASTPQNKQTSESSSSSNSSSLPACSSLSSSSGSNDSDGQEVPVNAQKKPLSTTLNTGGPRAFPITDFQADHTQSQFQTILPADKEILNEESNNPSASAGDFPPKETSTSTSEKSSNSQEAEGSSSGSAGSNIYQDNDTNERIHQGTSKYPNLLQHQDLVDNANLTPPKIRKPRFESDQLNRDSSPFSPGIHRSKNIMCTPNLIVLGDEETNSGTLISPCKPQAVPSDFYPPGVRMQLQEISTHRHIRGEPELLHAVASDVPGETPGSKRCRKNLENEEYESGNKSLESPHVKTLKIASGENKLRNREDIGEGTSNERKLLTHNTENVEVSNKIVTSETRTASVQVEGAMLSVVQKFFKKVFKTNFNAFKDEMAQKADTDHQLLRAALKQSLASVRHMSSQQKDVKKVPKKTGRYVIDNKQKIVNATDKTLMRKTYLSRKKNDLGEAKTLLQKRREIIALDSIKSKCIDQGSTNMASDADFLVKNGLEMKESQKTSERPLAYSQKTSERPLAYSQKASERPLAYSQKTSERPLTYSQKTSEGPLTYPEKTSERPLTYSQKASERPLLYKCSECHLSSCPGCNSHFDHQALDSSSLEKTVKEVEVSDMNSQSNELSIQDTCSNSPRKRQSGFKFCFFSGKAGKVSDMSLSKRHKSENSFYEAYREESSWNKILAQQRNSEDRMIDELVSSLDANWQDVIEKDFGEKPEILFSGSSDCMQEFQPDQESVPNEAISFAGKIPSSLNEKTAADEFNTCHKKESSNFERTSFSSSHLHSNTAIQGSSTLFHSKKSASLRQSDLHNHRQKLVTSAFSATSEICMVTSSDFQKEDAYETRQELAGLSPIGTEEPDSTSEPFSPNGHHESSQHHTFVEREAKVAVPHTKIISSHSNQDHSHSFRQEQDRYDLPDSPQRPIRVRSKVGKAKILKSSKRKIFQTREQDVVPRGSLMSLNNRLFPEDEGENSKNGKGISCGQRKEVGINSSPRVSKKGSNRQGKHERCHEDVDTWPECNLNKSDCLNTTFIINSTSDKEDEDHSLTEKGQGSRIINNNYKSPSDTVKERSFSEESRKRLVPTEITVDELSLGAISLSEFDEDILGSEQKHCDETTSHSPSMSSQLSVGHDSPLSISSYRFSTPASYDSSPRNTLLSPFENRAMDSCDVDIDLAKSSQKCQRESEVCHLNMEMKLSRHLSFQELQRMTLVRKSLTHSKSNDMSNSGEHNSNSPAFSQPKQIYTRTKSQTVRRQSKSSSSHPQNKSMECEENSNGEEANPSHDGRSTGRINKSKKKEMYEESVDKTTSSPKVSKANDIYHSKQERTTRMQKNTQMSDRKFSKKHNFESSVIKSSENDDNLAEYSNLSEDSSGDEGKTVPKPNKISSKNVFDVSSIDINSEQSHERPRKSVKIAQLLPEELITTGSPPRTENSCGILRRLNLSPNESRRKAKVQPSTDSNVSSFSEICNVSKKGKEMSAMQGKSRAQTRPRSSRDQMKVSNFESEERRKLNNGSALSSTEVDAEQLSLTIKAHRRNVDRVKLKLNTRLDNEMMLNCSAEGLKPANVPEQEKVYTDHDFGKDKTSDSISKHRTFPGMTNETGSPAENIEKGEHLIDKDIEDGEILDDDSKREIHQQSSDEEGTMIHKETDNAQFVDTLTESPKTKSEKFLIRSKRAPSQNTQDKPELLVNRDKPLSFKKSKNIMCKSDSGHRASPLAQAYNSSPSERSDSFNNSRLNDIRDRGKKRSRSRSFIDESIKERDRSCGSLSEERRERYRLSSPCLDRDFDLRKRISEKRKRKERDWKSRTSKRDKRSYRELDVRSGERNSPDNASSKHTRSLERNSKKQNKSLHLVHSASTSPSDSHRLWSGSEAEDRRREELLSNQSKRSQIPNLRCKDHQNV